jgi:GT2 family glycosyltransferase
LSAPIALITVQYNNPHDTVRLMDSLASIDDLSDCRVHVVDNSTTTELRANAALFEKRAPVSVEVLLPPRNLYYWGAAAYAIEKLETSESGIPDWVIVCNNDLTIEDPLFLRKIRSLDPQKFPIVAPRIISSTRTEQNPLLDSPPTVLKRLKWRVYDLHFAIARAMLSAHKILLRTRSTPALQPSTIEYPRRIYAPHGAFVIFSREFFARGGSLDTTVPMFAEELTIAVTAVSLGLPVWYYPDLVVFHREHSTTGRDLTRRKYEMERMARRRYYSLLEKSPALK